MRDWWNGLSDALSTVATIIGVVVAMASAWAVFWTWAKTWDWMQKGVAIFIAACLVFLLVLAIYTWWRKTRIHTLPKQLYRLDGIVRGYVGKFDPNAVPPQDIEALGKDLAELMKVAIYPFQEAYRRRDKKQIAKVTTNLGRYANTVASLADPRKSGTESLKRLMQMSALMNQHGTGLKAITDTPQYQKLFKHIRELERIQPDPQVSIALDNYFRWSDGLYSQLIAITFVTSQPEMFDLSPPELKATVAYAKPVIEDYVDVLIATVSERLTENKKNRGDEKRGAEK